MNTEVVIMENFCQFRGFFVQKMQLLLCREFYCEYCKAIFRVALDCKFSSGQHHYLTTEAQSDAIAALFCAVEG